LKNKLQNLLSGKVLERVVLTLKLSKITPSLRSGTILRYKIKLEFPKKVYRLAIISLIIFEFLGYYPNLSVPPIKRSQAIAQGLEEKGEIIPASFSKPLNLPHPGYLTTRFSFFHPGIDIAAGLGMPIHPITDGVVEEVGYDIFGLGNYVVVSHENAFKSKYAHLGKIYVKAKEKVTPSNILGEVGLSGHTSGPHTHLEITHDGGYIDPQKLLPEIPDMPKVNLVKI